MADLIRHLDSGSKAGMTCKTSAARMGLHILIAEPQQSCLNEE